MTKKRKRREPEQIVKALQEGEAMLFAAEVYQKLSISKATWMRWKERFGVMKSDEVKRLREIEVENQRLKELIAGVELDKRILREAGKRASGPGLTADLF